LRTTSTDANSFSLLSTACSDDADIVLVDPVPSRQLLADSEGSEGSAGDYGYGYGYGYYQDIVPYSGGGRRRLMGMEGEEGDSGYGYYGYYQGATPYSSGRRLSEVDAELEPTDSQQQQQQEEVESDVAPAAVFAVAVKAAHTADKEVAVPVGNCYCQFDSDFNTFAIGEERCKDALYQKCKVRIGERSMWVPSKGQGNQQRKNVRGKETWSSPVGSRALLQLQQLPVQAWEAYCREWCLCSGSTTTATARGQLEDS
jgi:hypothetical protein